MKQNIQHAAGLYTLACFFVVCMTAFGKVLSEVGLHPIEISFYRNAGALTILSIYIIATKKFHLLKTNRPKAQLNRAILGNIGVTIFFWACSLMPLANVTAILYLAPIILTILSAVFLKESVGIVRILAVIFGFIGALFLVQASSNDYSVLGTIMAFTNAFIIALIGISLRSLGSSEHALTTTFYFSFIGTIFIGLMVPFVWTTLPDFNWILIGLILTGLLNQPLKTQAFRLAPASIISPIQYMNIIWATIIGYLVWHDVPTINVIIGCLIVIASNLFIFWRERTKTV